MNRGAVEIFEVGPRDGLQNEARAIPLAEKIALVDALSNAGFRRIEVGAFVRPDRVPQMAGSADVLAGIRRAPGVRYAALTPNLKGLAAAQSAGADEVSVFASASEGFSQSNLNMSVSESLMHFRAVSRRARDLALPVRGYVSCIAVCPFDGVVDASAVTDVAAALFEMGCYEVSLGDTVGQATPEQVTTVIEACRAIREATAFAGHFHDTDGLALRNIDAALACGLRVFDTSISGLGGCPYAPGAPGNVATESVVARLHELGYDTGLDMAALQRAAKVARTIVGRG